MVDMSSEDKTKPRPIGPTLAVGAVVFKESKVLLVKRGNSPAKGMWAIPGGKVRLGETLQQATEREIFEETGIKIKAGDPIYSFELIEQDEDGIIQYHYYIVDLEGEFISGSVNAGDDAVKAGWISEGDLEKIRVNPKTLDLLRRKYDFGLSFS